MGVTFFAAAAALLAAGAPPALALDPGRRYFYADIFQPFYERKDWALVPARPGNSARPLLAKKAPGMFRAFGVGGSIGQAYFLALEEDLRAALPGREVEASNCAMPGYDSSREAMVLDELLEYEPDLIVLLTGHNEKFAVEAQRVPLWILRAQDRLSRIADFQRRIDELTAPRVDDAEQAELRARALERNLTGLLQAAAARKVPVVVFVPPLNYRDYPPSDFKVLREPGFISGRVAFMRGDFAGAERAWKALLVSDAGKRGDAAAVILHHLGRAADRAGRVKEAGKFYDRASDASFSHSFCTARCQAIIRRVAAKEGALVAEVDEAFRSAAKPSRPGLDMFYDGYHWQSQFHSLASSALVDALSRARVGGAEWTALPAKPVCRFATSPGECEADGAIAALSNASYEAESSSAEMPLRRSAVAAAARIIERFPAWFEDPEALRLRVAAWKRRRLTAFSNASTEVARARWLWARPASSPRPSRRTPRSSRPSSAWARRAPSRATRRPRAARSIRPPPPASAPRPPPTAKPFGFNIISAVGLTLFDAASGEIREFRPAAPPAVGVESAASGPRERETAAALERALAFLGLEPRAGGELRVGGDAPRPGALWLKVAPLEGAFEERELASRGFESADLLYLCLRTHYRKPLAFSWDALARARSERLGLLDSLRSLSTLSLEPSPRGFPGYLQRFKLDLSRDLDTPGAVDCLWDALRPGALSPGSKAALLRTCLPALGLA